MHGGGVAEQRGFGGFDPMQGMQQPGGGPMQGMAALMAAYQSIDLNELLAGKDLNSLLTGFSLTDLLTEAQLTAIFGEHADLTMLEMPGSMNRGFGGMMPRSMESSAEIATDDFVLTRESNAFSNLTVAK